MSGNVAITDYQKNISLPLDSNLGNYLYSQTSPRSDLVLEMLSFFLRTAYPEELRHKII